MKLFAVTSLLLSCLAYQTPALASSELDPVVPPSIPQGLIVKISPDGKRDVYKANLERVVDNPNVASNALNTAINDENKLESINPASELDRTSSDESWHWSWHGSSGFSYHFHSRLGNYDYLPSYSYHSGGYQYNYYYSPAYYGYHPACHYSDPYGYHYSSNYGWHGPHC